MVPSYNNKHNKVLLCLTDTSFYICILLNTSGWQTFKKFGDSIMERSFTMSDNKVLKNTLQTDRAKVSEQIRGVHITCCIVRACYLKPQGE